MKQDEQDKISIALKLMEIIKPLSQEARELVVKQLVDLIGLKTDCKDEDIKVVIKEDRTHSTPHSKANALKTLIDEKQAKTDMDKLVIVIYYLEEILKEKDSFSAKDISEMSKMAGIPIFKRIPSIISDIKQRGKGWITTIGKSHKLSNKGLKYVLAMPNQKEN